MSANLVVDLGSTCDYRTSVAVGSGSNLIVGEIVDLLHANTYCNIFVAAGAGSGTVELRIQTSDSTLSGTFTDPTSGMAAGNLPDYIASGGVFFANSGIYASGNQSFWAPVANAPLFASGGVAFGAFLRQGRYARLLFNSGPFPNYVTAGFISNKRTIGSGGGSTFSPGSGGISV